MNKLLKYGITIVVIVSAAYFGNKGVQTYLGKQAVGNLAFDVYSLEQAIELADINGKLVLADYSAIWCPSCRKLDTQVFANEKVAAKINSHFIYARLDYDSKQGAEFAKQHGLVGFPRVLVLDTTGGQLTELPLTFDPYEYVNNLESVSRTFLSN